MKQHCPQIIASSGPGYNRAGFAASTGQAAVQSRRFILSQNFLARALVLGLLLISILR